MLRQQKLMDQKAIFRLAIKLIPQHNVEDYLTTKLNRQDKVREILMLNSNAKKL
jgi:hypothetical protein